MLDYDFDSGEFSSRDKLPKKRIQTAKFNKHQQTLDLITEYQSPETLPHQKERLADQIISINEGLCRKAANRYTYPGVDVEALVNLGRAGIKKAIDKFDLSLGNKFSTYAMPWIRQQILLSVQHDNPIHVPDSAHRVNKKAQKLIAEGITETQQIAEILGKDVLYVQDCLDMCRRVRQIPVTPEGDEILFSDSVLITDSDSFDYENLSDSQKIVRQALSKLNPIIQEIVFKRLDDWKFKEIAEFYQLTSAKVQSIYKQVKAWIEDLFSPNQPESNADIQAESTQAKPQALTVEDNESTDSLTDIANSKDSEPVVTIEPTKSKRRNRLNILTQLLGRLTDRAALKSNGDRPATNFLASTCNSTLTLLQSLQNPKTACLDVGQIVRNKLSAALTEQGHQFTITKTMNPWDCKVVIGSERKSLGSNFEFGLSHRTLLSYFVDRTSNQLDSPFSSPTFSDFLATANSFRTDIANLANTATVAALDRLKFLAWQAHQGRLLAKPLQGSDRIPIRFRVLNNIRSFDRGRCCAAVDLNVESVNPT